MKITCLNTSCFATYKNEIFNLEIFIFRQKHLSNKYGQNLLDSAKKLQQMQ